jgi:hypothetical protein
MFFCDYWNFDVLMGIDKNRTVSAYPQNIGDYFEMKANIFLSDFDTYIFGI